MSGIESAPYKVLALKYRPENFDGLIGQNVLVRTITNAINTNRIANAFLLTGIRGVGKTTTARIIARVLNCIGEDGNGSATPTPCGVCVNCKSIKEDRHPDVIEMDAASRTGVDDIREIIENVKYLPTIARYKIYIIDEVHMLSKNAFNALLKTLEEPPDHVKFIFATTEIRKIPITILSRCQRFDLRRIDNEMLVSFLEKIAEKEGAKIERGALEMIANASEGSVRDSLSLLDQSISHTESEITAEIARDMLGLADKTKIIDIFETVAKGDITSALATLKELYDASADPVLIANDLLEFSYLVTKLKVMPSLILTGFIPENEYTRAKEISENLQMSYLTRVWQMLLKGLSEVKVAPNTLSAVEMVLIRLAYISDLPSPAAIIKKLNSTPQTIVTQTSASSVNSPTSVYEPVGNLLTAPSPQLETEPVAQLNSFNELVELFREKNEVLLYNLLLSDVRLIKFAQGRLEISLCSTIPSDFPKKVSKCLKDWTGNNWLVVNSHEEGQISLRDQKQKEKNDLKEKLSKQSDVNKILEMFPGACITKVEESTN